MAKTATVNGLGALWIVTRATNPSTLVDILFEATPRELALQVRGGLAPDEILGWFDDYGQAYSAAVAELFRVRNS